MSANRRRAPLQPPGFKTHSPASVLFPFPRDSMRAKNQVKKAAPHEAPINMRGVSALARACRYDPRHAGQVARLALQLFDALKPLHGLNRRDRALLKAAGLLHDIGWLQGGPKHHKTARRIIRSSPLLSIAARDRQVLGETVRYHRKALPCLRHAGFRALQTEDRAKVTVLAGLLRVADGLDRSHTECITSLACSITETGITIFCRAKGPAAIEFAAASAKSLLLANIFQRKFLFICRRV